VLLSFFVITSSPLEQACDRTCNQIARFGLSITVRDASTGAELCNSSVVAFDGLNRSYRESLGNIIIPDLPSAPCTFRGAEEREGIYRVEISNPGYISKTEQGLIVRKEDSSDCHIVGVERTVTLERDPLVPRELDASTD
jgi:hypothetical protein